MLLNLDNDVPQSIKSKAIEIADKCAAERQPILEMATAATDALNEKISQLEEVEKRMLEDGKDGPAATAVKMRNLLIMTNDTILNLVNELGKADALIILLKEIDQGSKETQ